MFDSHSRDQNSNISAACTVILLKSGFLPSLENYKVAVYHLHFPINLYFQIQFIRVSCTLHEKNRIRNSIKNRRNRFCYEKETP